MQAWTETIPGTAPGLSVAVAFRRFGAEGARPIAHVQAGLHADEVPPMLAAHHLQGLLAEEEADGRLAGSVVVVPAANPGGLGQRVLGAAVGRFSLADGTNFNRLFPSLADAATRAGPDSTAIRAAMAAALAAMQPNGLVANLRRTLLGAALHADIVLDLHCGSEAVSHLYTLTPAAELFAPLAGWMGAHAVLVATDSGDDPFDEACSRPWLRAREVHGDAVPLGCAAATLEFRGERDVSHALARSDAEAILSFLRHAGVLHGELAAETAPPVPVFDLARAEPLRAPSSGMLVFSAEPGAVFAAGDPVAEIVCPLTGAVAVVRTDAGGLLYTRTTARFVLAGERLGSVAGTGAGRSGRLLSD